MASDEECVTPDWDPIALALLILNPQVAFYLARKKTDLSVNEIGVFFAGRYYTADHQLITLFEDLPH
jgi:hypothetical protein